MSCSFHKGAVEGVRNDQLVEFFILYLCQLILNLLCFLEASLTKRFVALLKQGEHFSVIEREGDIGYLALLNRQVSKTILLQIPLYVLSEVPFEASNRYVFINHIVVIFSFIRIFNSTLKGLIVELPADVAGN